MFAFLFKRLGLKLHLAIIIASYLMIPTGLGAQSVKIFQDCTDCPVMTRIPLGEFTMGSPEEENARDPDEGPQIRVEISAPFAVGIHEVTFSEWELCHAENYCEVYPGDVGWGRGNNPVIHVSWSDAVQYTQWLTHKTGQPYRLLTEAEWEYVARAGTTTVFHVGNTLRGTDANFDAVRPYPLSLASGDDLNPFRKRFAKPVGQYPANAFGLFDIHGNVSEWVQDCYDPAAYSVFSDYPQALGSENNLCDRVTRGGTSHYSGAYARSANRHGYEAGTRSLDIGFRVARSLN